MDTSGIAIVGIGAILPDALDSVSLWSSILAGHSAIRPVPEELWPENTFYDPSYKIADKSFSRLGAVVRGFDFRGRDFNLPPLVEQNVDLAQKAALVAARAALAQAGITGATDGINCAVIVGNAGGGRQLQNEHTLAVSHYALEATLERLPSVQGLGEEFRRRVLAELRQAWRGQLAPMTSSSLPGALGNIIAARIAHFYNFHGPAQTVDAACASSLAAFEAAVLGLRAHRFDLALAGGVDFVMDPSTYAGFSAMEALSDTGSFPFDERADGFVMGEGAVLFVLKRLVDAEAAGDHICGIIEGIGSSSDGRGRSLIAPNYWGQVRALKRAYADAGVSPERLGYVEAHGTATPIGDPIEIYSMRQVFSECPRCSIPLGSIKSNIGHLKAAAGAAGLLRAVLAIENQTIPPQANFEKANRRCQLDESPLRIPCEAEEWPANKTHASVSAFGFGGINYHVIIRQPEQRAAGSRRSRCASATLEKETVLDFGIVAFGADSQAELLREARRLRDQAHNPSSLFSALRERPEPRTAPFRLSFFVEQADATADMFDAAIAGIAQHSSHAHLGSKGIYYRETAALGSDALVFMFPGQGSQYLGMLTELRRKLPVIDATLSEADEILHAYFPRPLSSYFAASGDGPESERFEQLSATQILQPAIVACNEAIRRALSPLVEPGLVFGHSLGECSAAIAAGVMTFPEGLEFAAARGRAMSEERLGEPGLLLQVAANEDKLRAMLPGLGEDVAIANKNCPRQTVLGGRAAAIREAEKMLRATGLNCSVLPVSNAFHTELMRPAVEHLLDRLAATPLKSPRTPFLSGIDGESAPLDDDAPGWFRARLSRQIVEPVDYVGLVRAAYARGARVFLEVGPKQVQCGFVTDILDNNPHQVLPSCQPKVGEIASLGRALAGLVAEGAAPYGGRRATGAALERRPPYVGRLPESAAPPETAPSVAVATAEPSVPPLPAGTPTGQTFSQILDKVADDPGFWQFVARQAPAMASYLVGSYSAMVPSLQQPAPAQTASSQMAITVTPPPSQTAPVIPAPPMTVPFAAGATSRPEDRKPAPMPVDASTASDQWIVERTAAFLDYAVEEVAIDMPLESGLGVDAIRQGELVQALASELGSAPASADIPRTGDITLRQLAAHLPGRSGEKLTRSSETAAADVSLPAESAPRPLADIILHAIARKTGYTLDELKLDADIEYDLGIDSISQMEILLQVEEELQLPVDESFRISDYPTLRALIAYVESRSHSFGGTSPRIASLSGDMTSAVGPRDRIEPPFYCRRLVLEPCPPPGEQPAPGRTLVLHDGAAPKLVAWLGGAARRLDPDTSATEIAEALTQGIDTLIVLGDAHSGVDSPLDAAADAVRTAFRIGLALYAARNCVSRVVVVGGTGADSRPDGEPGRVARLGATMAAWRSLVREWSELAPCELGTIEVAGALDSRVEDIAREIGSSGPHELRMAHGGERTTPVLRAFERPTRARLDAASVVMVTGGARGIMARIARALFEASRCKLVLVGRTVADHHAQPIPETVEALTAACEPEDAPLARDVTALPEDRGRRAEVAETLAALTAAGAEALYLQADLGKPGELARVLGAARARFGRVDVLVHGAGVDNSKALTAKGEQELLDVLRPKLAPLADLAGVDDRPFLVVISSIAARFGNRGQLEYSAANEALARVAVSEGGLALDFGPWRDVGMAARFKHAMTVRGIDLLDCEVAAKEAAHAITGWPPGEYVIAGRIGRAPQGPYGLPTTVDLDIPGSELITSYELELNNRAWLYDHRWQGVGLVPGVVSLAGFIHAARLIAASLPVTSVERLDLYAPVLVRPSHATRVQIQAVRGKADDDGLLVETQVLAGERTMHRATVVLGGRIEAIANPDPRATDPRATDPRATDPCATDPGPSRDEIYTRHYFHGESFQVLATTALGQTGALGVSLPLDLPLGADLPEAWRAATLTHEVAWQTAGLFLAVRRREAALPVGFLRLRLHSAPREGEVVTARALFVGEENGISRFDVVLTGDDGRVIEQIDGLAFGRPPQ
jgi:acyl transferase domain-containing protein/NAD(P)-dependent dehydrogenase (short-subunit alcohol dehydrogenase family)